MKSTITVVILYQEIPPDATEDEKDTLIEVALVCQALEGLGHSVVELTITLDLDKARQKLLSLKPDIVFNLVESLSGRGEFIHFAPGLLDSLGIPYTGCRTEALFLTTHKIIAKTLMRSNGIPTPDWYDYDGNASGVVFPCIVKNVWEHASHGIDDNALVTNSQDLEKQWSCRKGRFFVEHYIDGREFNVAVVNTPQGPRVLPIAEICFVDYPEGKPKIVGFEAKWQSDSFEYINTPRTFDFPESDQCLLEELERISLACFEIFCLSGYARVDFRVDAKGKPFVLEINANPCLSPDAGVYNAALKAGFTRESFIEMIIEDALFGRAKEASPSWIRAHQPVLPSEKR